MKKDLWAVVLFIGAYVMLNLLIYFFSNTWADALIQQFAFVQDRPKSLILFILFMLQESILCALFLIVFWWRKRGGSKEIVSYMSARRDWKGWTLFRRWSVGGFFVYFLFSVVLYSFLAALNISIPGLYGEQMVMTMLEAIPLEARYDYLLIVVVAVIIGPLVEEILFRGFLTDTLAKQRGWGGVGVAAGLFALAHMERGVVINLAILSFFLGYIYRKTRSLRYSFLFHVGINGLAVMILLLTTRYPALAG